MAKRKPCKPKPKDDILSIAQEFSEALRRLHLNGKIDDCWYPIPGPSYSSDRTITTNPAQVITPIHIK